jgi:miniconductance mechanosensitive channel
MDTINNDLTNLLQQMGVHKESLGITQRIVIIAGILIIAFVADYFCRKIVVPTIKKLTARTQATWDDYLFNDAVLDNMCHLIPPIILYVLLPFAFPHEPVTLTFILKLCWVYITAVAMKLICSFLTSLYTISSEHEKLKNHPLKGVYQMIKLIVICVGVIIIVSTLIDKDPVNILTGLGASAAILMLVFKDTIMGLVAGVQLSANDMLRPGDWITMPKYGADGTVIEVTLTTVKVRNWDNTITTVPPYALVSDSFQNMPRPALPGAFKNKMLHKMRHPLLVFEFIACSGIHRKTTISHLRQGGFMDDAQAVRQCVLIMARLYFFC